MFSNDYGTPLLSADSSPESTGLLSSHGEWASNDEIEYMHPNLQANEDVITNSPAYPGIVSAGLRYMEKFMNQKNNQMSQQVHHYQEYSPAELIFNFDGQNLQQGFTLEYIDFPEQLYKTQKRVKGLPSKQVVVNPGVSFLLDFNSKENKSNVKEIRVKIKRLKENDNPSKAAGEVPVSAHCEHVQETKVLVTVNIDACESNGKDIYELARSRTDDYNMYHLIVEVVFKDELVFKHCTRPFKIVGKKKATAKVGTKRSHSGSLTSNDSFTDSNTSLSPNCGSESSSSSSTPGLIQARKVVAEHIATKTLEIDGLKMGKAITTSNGDIAYHYPLRDESQTFEEGEVVGLFPDESQANGTYIIDKLSSKNSSDAALKGVITRSQYLEAQVPKNGESTETICMLGIVPVQVIGSVLHNEGIYASPFHPGCGISEHNLDISLINESSFIGYAFSSRKTNDEKSMGFVQAGVSVLETAGKYMLDERLRQVEENFDGKIEKVKEDNRRSKKCAIITAVISTILLTLLSIFLWQLLMPGSAYRYHICKIGRNKPHRQAFYHFIPYRDIFTYPRVNGIEFTFNSLMKKTHHTDYNQLDLKLFNVTAVRYYLNVDRCAYGGLRESRDLNTGQKLVYGPDVFAIDSNCNHVFYYNENQANGWVKYNSASWEHRNVFCDPPPPGRNFMNKKTTDMIDETVNNSR